MARLRQQTASIQECPADFAQLPLLQFDSTPRRSKHSPRTTTCPVDVAELPLQHDGTHCRSQNLSVRTPRYSSESDTDDSLQHDRTPHKNQKHSPWSTTSSVDSAKFFSQHDNTPKKNQKHSPWSIASSVDSARSFLQHDSTPRTTQKHSAWSIASSVDSARSFPQHDSTPRTTQKHSAWSTTFMRQVSWEKRGSGGQQCATAVRALPVATSLRSRHRFHSNPISGTTTSGRMHADQPEEQKGRASSDPPGISSSVGTPNSYPSRAAVWEPPATSRLRSRPRFHTNPTPGTTTSGRICAVQPEEQQGHTSPDPQGTYSSVGTGNNYPNTTLRSRLHSCPGGSSVFRPTAAALAESDSKVESNDPACLSSQSQCRKSSADIDADFEDLFSAQFDGNSLLSLPPLENDIGVLTIPSPSSQPGNSDSDSNGSGEAPSSYAAHISKHQDVKDTMHMEEGASPQKGKSYSNRMQHAVRRVSSMLTAMKKMSQTLTLSGDLRQDLEAQEMIGNLDPEFRSHRRRKEFKTMPLLGQVQSCAQEVAEFDVDAAAM